MKFIIFLPQLIIEMKKINKEIVAIVDNRTSEFLEYNHYQFLI